MLNKILKSLYLALFLVTPLLMYRDTSELFEFNKILFIYFITVLVLFFWFLKMILYKKIILNKTPLFIPILLFLSSQVISTIFSIDVHTSIFGYYGRFNGGLISIIAYLILFFGYVSNFEREFTFKILKASLLSSFVVILWGLSGRFGHDLTCLVFTGQFDNSCWTDQFKPAERMFSTLGQPNWLGAYLAINFFIGVFFLICGLNDSSVIPSDSRVKRGDSRGIPLERDSSAHSLRSFGRNDNAKLFVYSLYLFLNFTSILFTRSRSALAAVAMCLVIFFLFIVVKARKSFVVTGRDLSLRLFILFLIIFIPLFLFKTGEDKIDKYFSLSTYIQKSNSLNHQTVKSEVQVPQKPSQFVIDKVTPSSEIRQIVWTASWDLIDKYPLSGTGPETFGYAYYFVRPVQHNLTSEWDYLYNKAHNEYINYLATTGIVGFGTYILFILVFVFWCIKHIFCHPPEEGDLINNGHNENWIPAFAESDSAFAGMTQYTLLYLSLFLTWITILITNFFGFSITVINLYFFLIPALLITVTNNLSFRVQSGAIVPLAGNPVSSGSRVGARDDKQEPGMTNVKQKILIGFNALFTLYLILSIFLYFFADLKYAEGNNAYKSGDYENGYRNLNTALSWPLSGIIPLPQIFQEHVYEDKLSYILANLAFFSASEKKTDLAKNEILLSDYYNVKSIQASPMNVLYWKTRSKNYYLFYEVTLDKKNLETAQEALVRAAELSPSDPKIPYSKALFYSLMADEEKDKTKKGNYQLLSIKKLEESIILKPNFLDGYFFKGQLLKKYGKKAEARQVFEFILKNLNPNDQEVKKEMESLQ